MTDANAERAAIPPIGEDPAETARIERVLSAIGRGGNSSLDRWVEAGKKDLRLNQSEFPDLYDFPS